MHNGCVHIDPVGTKGDSGTCRKYNKLCNPTIQEKRKCPVWSEAVAIETYYDQRLALDRRQESFMTREQEELAKAPITSNSKKV